MKKNITLIIVFITAVSHCELNISMVHIELKIFQKKICQISIESRIQNLAKRARIYCKQI